MILLIVAVGCNGFIYSGEQSAMLDIGNNFAGTLMGVINALGNTMGFVAPMIVGKIVNGHNDVENWQVKFKKFKMFLMKNFCQYVFWIAVVIYTIGSVIFIIFGSSTEQEWNRRISVIERRENQSINSSF